MISGIVEWIVGFIAYDPLCRGALLALSMYLVVITIWFKVRWYDVERAHKALKNNKEEKKAYRRAFTRFVASFCSHAKQKERDGWDKLDAKLKDVLGEMPADLVKALRESIRDLPR